MNDFNDNKKLDELVDEIRKFENDVHANVEIDPAKYGLDQEYESAEDKRKFVYDDNKKSRFRFIFAIFKAVFNIRKHIFAGIASAALIVGMYFVFTEFTIKVFKNPLDPENTTQVKECPDGQKVPTTSVCPTTQFEYIYKDGKYVDTTGTEHSIRPATAHISAAAAKTDARNKIYSIELKNVVATRTIVESDWITGDSASFITSRDEWITLKTTIQTKTSKLHTYWDADITKTKMWSDVFEGELGTTTLPDWVNRGVTDVLPLRLGSERQGSGYTIHLPFNDILNDLVGWIDADKANRDFTCDTNDEPDWTSPGAVEYKKWLKMTTYETIFSEEYWTPECLSGSANIRKLYDVNAYGNDVRFPNRNFTDLSLIADPINATTPVVETNNWSIIGSQHFATYLQETKPKESEYVSGQTDFDAAFIAWRDRQDPIGAVEWNVDATNATITHTNYTAVKAAIRAFIDTIVQDTDINKNARP